MDKEQQRQQAEDRREAAATQHQQAEDQRSVMEDGRQIAEELRDTRDHMRTEHGEEQHTSLERRITHIEAYLRRLDERFAQLEQHLLEHVETMHHQIREQETKNQEHIERARATIESGRQRMQDTEELIERVHGQMRKFQE
jgi:chromosome segregation ATPase